jgi:hypothetical protein
LAASAIALDIRGVDCEQLEPIVEYSRYVLMKGSYIEQGRLVEGIKSKFVISARKLALIQFGV